MKYSLNARKFVFLEAPTLPIAFRLLFQQVAPLVAARRPRILKSAVNAFVNFRYTVIVGISLIALGCATEPPISEARWRAEKAYEQQWARDDGRIGYIGNAGATAGGN